MYVSQYNITEPRCGPLSGAPNSLLPLPSSEVDAPQPLIDRRPSISLFKWGSGKRSGDAPTPTAARQGLSLAYLLIRYFLLFFCKQKLSLKKYMCITTFNLC